MYKKVQIINASIIQAIENLYNNAHSEVCSMATPETSFELLSEFDRDTYYPKPLFNIFQYRRPEDCKRSASIGGWIIIDFHFADDIFATAEKRNKKQFVMLHVQCTTGTRFRMDVGSDSTKIMSNNFKRLRDQDKYKV